MAKYSTKKGGFLRRKSKDLVVKKPEAKVEKDLPKEPTALVAADDPDWKMPPTDLLTKKQSPADAGNIQQNAGETGTGA